MNRVIEDTKVRIRQNAQQGQRTLLLCFYAGHGVQYNNKTRVLFNSNQRGLEHGGNQYWLESELRICAREAGLYVIKLFACDRTRLPEEVNEEVKRGGT